MKNKYVIKFNDGNYLSRNNSITKDLFSARLFDDVDKGYSIAKNTISNCVGYKTVAVAMHEVIKVPFKKEKGE